MGRFDFLDLTVLSGIKVAIKTFIEDLMKKAPLVKLNALQKQNQSHFLNARISCTLGEGGKGNSQN